MAKMEWFVQTFDPANETYLSEWETWHGYDEKAAREEFAKDHRIPQFAERRLISYGLQDAGDEYNRSRTVETRIVERFLAGPVTLHGNVTRNIRAWSTQGCKVSATLLRANETTTNEKANFVNIEDGMLSYLPAGKSHEINDDGTWAKDGRQTAKPGKFIRTIIVADELARLTDSDIEQFSNRVKAVNELQSGKMHVVRGADIAYWYHASSSGENRVSSCMAHDSRIKFLRMYCDNPENVGLLIMLDANGFMKGRALVWTLDDGRTFMDRIYGADSVRSAFRSHATQQGWIHSDAREYQNWLYNRQKDKPNEATLFCTMRRSYDPDGVYPDTGERVVHPYADTMRYLNAKTGRLTNDSRMRHTHLLGYAEGGASRVDIRWFPAEGEPEPRKDKWGTYLEDDEPDYTHRCDACMQRFVDPVYGEDVLNRYGDGVWYCERCLPTYAKNCETCNRNRTRDCFGRYRRQDDNQCASCFQRGRIECPNCGELEEADHITVKNHDYRYCRACIARYFKTCVVCNTERSTDEFLYNEREGYYRERIGICTPCWRQQRMRCEAVDYETWKEQMIRWMVGHGIDPHAMMETMRLSRRDIDRIVGGPVE